MKRSIWFWLSFIFAIILAIYFSSRIIMTGMGHGSASKIHSISISTDTPDMDMSALRATAGNLVRNTYDVNLTELNERFLMVPGVKKSAVRRLPNGNLSIKIEMHHPVALWSDGQYYYPLSVDGTIVQHPSDQRDATSVVFVGKLPNDIGEITNAVNQLSSHINYMEWIENRRWNLITTGGITVMLPETNPISAISSLLALHTNHNLLNKNITTIDMRDDARILVK